MALRMLENFSIYNRVMANVLRRWTSYTTPINNGSQSLVAGGRFSSDALNIQSGYAAGYVNNALCRTFDAQATWIVGIAFKPISPSYADLLQICDGATIQLYVRYGISNGKISVYRGGGTLLGTTTIGILDQTISFIETKAKIHSSTGTVEIRINGVTQLSLTGQNTQATANSTADVIKLGGAFADYGLAQYSNIYICDGSATTPNDFLGDVRIDMLNPNAAGNSDVWIGSDADHVDNHLLVDDASVPDDDTTYVETSTPGDIDLYSIQDSGVGAVIKGVEVITLARKTDAGTRTMRVKTRQGSTNYNGTTLSLLDTYTYLSELFNVAPDSSAWTKAILDALEVGYELVA